MARFQKLLGLESVWKGQTSEREVWEACMALSRVEVQGVGDTTNLRMFVRKAIGAHS